MSHLILTVGIPGAGKSTWMRRFAISNNYEYVSRDNIRFSIVKEDEEYFSHENEVFDTFINQISNHLKENKVVIADATHLNRKARAKVLNALTVKPKTIEIIFFNTPLEIAIERNEERKGTRAYVPVNVIKRMEAAIETPQYDEIENFKYTRIWEKKPDILIYPISKEDEE